MEKQIVYLWNPTQWRFWRESELGASTKTKHFLEERHRLGPPGSATMAYSVDEDGYTKRIWWTWPPLSHVDGVDPPHELDRTPFKFIAPASIKPNEPSQQWEPLRVPAKLRNRLDKRPTNLMTRWEKWTYRNRPRVVRAKTRFGWLRRLFRKGQQC